MASSVRIQEPCYIIAEAGVNHNGSLSRAKALVDAAAEAGANAVKFQTFRAENIITRDAPKAQYHVETTGADSIGSWLDLLKSQQLDRDMHEQLMKHCCQKKIDFLSTPYDVESVDLLDTLGVKLFKIASTDANNTSFLRYVATKGRPMILSTAMCDLAEVKNSVSVIRKEGVDALTVLQCTGSYPAPAAESNLRAMQQIRRECSVEVGYSDHVLDEDIALVAISLGATVYEKHITLDRTLPGPDHRASLEPGEFKKLIARIRKVETALGDGVKRLMPCEYSNQSKLRKFIVAKTAIGSGQKISYRNITTKRTGGIGLESSAWDSVIGKKVSRDMQYDDPITVSDLLESRSRKADKGK